MNESCTPATTISEQLRAAFDHADVAPKNIALRKAHDEIERLRAALVEHNDMLRSAFQAAQRDATHDTAGTTNFRLLADRLSAVLERHHAVTNEARSAHAG